MFVIQLSSPNGQDCMLSLYECVYSVNGVGTWQEASNLSTSQTVRSFVRLLNEYANQTHRICSVMEIWRWRLLSQSLTRAKPGGTFTRRTITTPFYHRLADGKALWILTNC